MTRSTTLSFRLVRALAGAALCAALPALAADVGVSINFAQPGMYGRIDIGNVGQPALLYAQPVVIQPAYAQPPQPIYLRVPPGHERHWSRHCREYNACGVPVYFVREDWYRDHYRGDHEEHRDHEQERGGDRGHDHDRGGDRGRDRGDDRGHDRERGDGRDR